MISLNNREFLLDECDRAEPILMDKMLDITMGRTKWYHRLIFWFKWTFLK